MAARFEVEVKISSARDVDNVNSRNGPLKPYAVVWVDPKGKCCTKVDEKGDTAPSWNEKLVIPLYGPIEESTLFIDIVHAHATEGMNPLAGSAKLSLREVVDKVGIGNMTERSLELKNSSGRPHGKVKVEVTLRDPRYRAQDPYHAPPPAGSAPTSQPYGGSYGAPASGSFPYGAPAPDSSPYAAPAPGSSAYGDPAPASPYGAPAPASPYGAPAHPASPYGAPAPAASPYGAPPPAGYPTPHPGYGQQQGYGAAPGYGQQPNYGAPPAPYGQQGSYGHPAYGSQGSQGPQGSYGSQGSYGQQGSY